MPLVDADREKLIADRLEFWETTARSRGQKKNPQISVPSDFMSFMVFIVK